MHLFPSIFVSTLLVSAALASPLDQAVGAASITKTTSTTCSFTSATPSPASLICGMEGKVKKSVSILSTEAAPNSTVCLDQCKSMPSCISFAYNTAGTECTFYSQTIKGNVFTVSSTTNMFFWNVHCFVQSCAKTTETFSLSKTTSTKGTSTKTTSIKTSSALSASSTTSTSTTPAPAPTNIVQNGNFAAGNAQGFTVATIGATTSFKALANGQEAFCCTSSNFLDGTCTLSQSLNTTPLALYSASFEYEFVSNGLLGGLSTITAPLTAAIITELGTEVGQINTYDANFLAVLPVSPFVLTINVPLGVAVVCITDLSVIPSQSG